MRWRRLKVSRLDSSYLRRLTLLDATCSSSWPHSGKTEVQVISHYFEITSARVVSLYFKMTKSVWWIGPSGRDQTPTLRERTEVTWALSQGDDQCDRTLWMERNWGQFRSVSQTHTPDLALATRIGSRKRNATCPWSLSQCNSQHLVKATDDQNRPFVRSLYSCGSTLGTAQTFSISIFIFYLLWTLSFYYSTWRTPYVVSIFKRLE